MKKLLIFILALVLALPLVAVGEESDAWYSIEGEVLTVRLPLSAIEGLSSNAQADPAPVYEVEATDSPQGIFELLTSEVQNDQWIASYRMIAEYSGAATLTFTTTCDDMLWSRYVLDISISQSGLEVVDEIKPWFGIYADNLRVRLPANSTTGYEWKYEISEPDMLELVEDEYIQSAAEDAMVGAGGLWTAEFGSTLSGAGEVMLILRYCRDWEDQAPAQEYTFYLWVAEDGGVTIESVEPALTEADEMFIDEVIIETPSDLEPLE